MEVENASPEISLGFRLAGEETVDSNCCYKKIIRKSVKNGYLNQVYCKQAKLRRAESKWTGIASVLSKRSVTKSIQSKNREPIEKEVPTLNKKDIAKEVEKEQHSEKDGPILNGECPMNLRITVERCKSRLLNGELVSNHSNHTHQSNGLLETKISPRGKQQKNGQCRLTSELENGKVYNSCTFSVFEDNCNPKALCANGGTDRFKIFKTTEKNKKQTRSSAFANNHCNGQEGVCSQINNEGETGIGNEAEIGADSKVVVGREAGDVIFSFNSVRLKNDFLNSTLGVVTTDVSFLSKYDSSHEQCSELSPAQNRTIPEYVKREKSFSQGSSQDCKQKTPNNIVCRSEFRTSCSSPEHPKEIDEKFDNQNSINCRLRSISARNDESKNILTLHSTGGKNDADKSCTSSKESDCFCKWVNCGAMLNGAMELKKHVKETHVKTMAESDLFFCFWKGCKVYNKPSSSYNWLVKHVNTHVGIRPFQCVIEPCDLSFASHSALVRHVQSHFNERSKYYKKPKDLTKESSASPGGKCKEDETMSSSESTSSKDLRKRRLKLFMRKTRPVTAHDTRDGFDRDSMEFVKKKLTNMENHRNFKMNGLRGVVQPLGKRTSENGDVQYLMAIDAGRRESEWCAEKDMLHDGLLQLPMSKLPTGQQERMYNAIFGSRKRQHRSLNTSAGSICFYGGVFRLPKDLKALSRKYGGHTASKDREDDH